VLAAVRSSCVGNDDGAVKYDRLQEYAKSKGGATECRIWLDKACLDQTDIDGSLSVLPIYLSGGPDASDRGRERAAPPHGRHCHATPPSHPSREGPSRQYRDGRLDSNTDRKPRCRPFLLRQAAKSCLCLPVRATRASLALDPSTFGSRSFAVCGCRLTRC
jgi:hypothetical protein